MAKTSETITWKLYTVNEVASILKVARRTVYRWIDKDVLEAIKIEGVWRVTEESVSKLLTRKSDNVSQEVKSDESMD